MTPLIIIYSKEWSEDRGKEVEYVGVFYNADRAREKHIELYEQMDRKKDSLIMKSAELMDMGLEIVGGDTDE